MLRIATLALLAISVPTYAQARRGGPGNLEQKLDQILKRLDRLEQHVANENKRAPKHDGADRRNDFRRFRLEFEGDRDVRRHDPRRDYRRNRRTDRAPRRGGGDRGPGDMRHPMGKFPQIIAAARQGDPRAKQMLMRMRAAIDAALGKPAIRGKMAPQPPASRARRGKPPAKAAGFRLVNPVGKAQGQPGTPGLRVRFANAEQVKMAELHRAKLEVKKAHADIMRREKAAKAAAQKQAYTDRVVMEKKAKSFYKKAKKQKKASDDDFARMKKLMAESKRLQQEIQKLRKELAAKQR